MTHLKAISTFYSLTPEAVKDLLIIGENYGHEVVCGSCESMWLRGGRGDTVTLPLVVALEEFAARWKQA